MLFSIFGEISLTIIGLLYVTNKWFNSFIDMMDLMKNNNEEENEKEMSESIKRMYS